MLDILSFFRKKEEETMKVPFSITECPNCGLEKSSDLEDFLDSFHITWYFIPFRGYYQFISVCKDCFDKLSVEELEKIYEETFSYMIHYKVIKEKDKNFIIDAMKKEKSNG